MQQMEWLDTFERAAKAKRPSVLIGPGFRSSLLAEMPLVRSGGPRSQGVAARAGRRASRKMQRAFDRASIILAMPLGEPSASQLVFAQRMNAAMLEEFLRVADGGGQFGSVDRIKATFGVTLVERYGLERGPFLNIARAYWTFALELEDVADQDLRRLYYYILKSLETTLGGLFFPTPGPATVPLPQRVEAMRMLLTNYAPSLNLNEFLKTNPVLRNLGYTHLESV